MYILAQNLKKVSKNIIIFAKSSKEKINNIISQK